MPRTRAAHRTRRYAGVLHGCFARSRAKCCKPRDPELFAWARFSALVVRRWFASCCDLLAELEIAIGLENPWILRGARCESDLFYGPDWRTVRAKHSDFCLKRKADSAVNC